MNIAVLAGSPKGEMSITLHYVKYLQKKLPEHEFRVIQIGSQIRKLENDAAAFQSVLDEVRRSDAVLWCFPVYVFLLPSQLKRFVELVFARYAESAFVGKYATALTTSVHFFDHTAHNYIRAISEDLGMNAVAGFSADMEDLLKPACRDNLVAFAGNFIRTIADRSPVEKVFVSINSDVPEYKPPEIPDVPKTGTRRIVLLTDAGEADINLHRMTDVFARSLPNAVDVVNINSLDLKGGCLGCCRCGESNICVYHDDLLPLFRDKLMSAEAIIFAGTIRSRYLSARWKIFFDRMFFNGHAPVLMGKQMASIVSGPLRQLPNLRQILEAESEMGRMHLAGIVTDEDADSARITALLKDLAARLLRHVEEHTPVQPTFLGVGGHKIFRDLIYELRFVFKADYLFYAKHGLFDYPQKNIRKRLQTGFFSLLTAIPAFRPAFYRMANSKMLEPYQKVVDQA
ncbi:MAG: NAD(P)H-dependent oxidoreductase [Verrucomicrobia bacterium]|nr:NAD(P)H-dependent oxidoreductase [Verrucomicrobiota bacterium]MBU4248332.1 NAD(P)H-dependent oxidoreductase [Verrucomicrobiota bacterium]MBU4291841.1 NAD(P)H-dependent oxidoreductase [Verrucomicrobiota bacterium]MBU4496670.1 NAD(P)H-dependent oxidoreductase [Verrucomicrobiota bacterium]MCG2680575.1 NAD(P)H-dependent oxidoreductase [Kiritimatiellia bacterium]